MIKFKQKNIYATVLLWLFFGMCIVILLGTVTNVYTFLAQPLVRDEAPDTRDVIIILGGGIVTDLKMLPWGVQERVDAGLGLYEEGYSQNIIVAGGRVQGHDYSESQFMEEYIRWRGFEEARIIEESRSTSTYENAINSLAIMEGQNWSTAFVVTSDYHTRRACKVFEKLNADIICIAAYERVGFSKNLFRNAGNFRAVVREYAATIYYMTRGYI